MPKLRLPKPGEIWCVPGKQGSRKSTWLKEVCAQDSDAAVIVADFCDEWSPEGRPTKHVTLGPMTRRVDLLDLELEPEIIDQRPLRLAVVLKGSLVDRAAQLRKLVVDVLKVYEAADRDITLVIEETFALAPLCLDTYNELAALARHAGLGLVLVSQFYKGIPAPLRRQATLIAAHLQDDDLDIEALGKRWRNKPLAEKVAELPRGERIIWRESAPANPRSKRKGEVKP